MVIYAYKFNVFVLTIELSVKKKKKIKRDRKIIKKPTENSLDIAHRHKIPCGSFTAEQKQQQTKMEKESLIKTS